MSLTYWIPFFIVVLGNIGYHVVAKATPTAAPPFLALSVTYLVSFLLCAEFGYILLYRAGWKISMASLLANVSVALLLAGIGVLLYKDVLMPRQIIGIILCLAGVFFLRP